MRVELEVLDELASHALARLVVRQHPVHLLGALAPHAALAGEEAQHVVQVLAHAQVVALQAQQVVLVASGFDLLALTPLVVDGVLEADLRLADDPIAAMDGEHERLVAVVPVDLDVHLTRADGHRHVLVAQRHHLLVHEDAPLVRLAVLLEVVVEGGRRVCGRRGLERQVRHLHVHHEQLVALADQVLDDRQQERVVLLVVLNK